MQDEPKLKAQSLQVKKKKSARLLIPNLYLTKSSNLSLAHSLAYQTQGNAN